MHRMSFDTNQIVFLDDGGLQRTFHGIMNDTPRTGFPVSVTPSSNGKLYPVRCLYVYINGTNMFREGESAPVFYLSSSRITNCLVHRLPKY
jgi:hypothetical protein